MAGRAKSTMLSIDTSAIFQGDAFALLDRIPDESIKLVLTSPPYNIGKSYERGMFSSLQDYTDWMHELIKKLLTKVRPDGSICWQVGNHVADGAITPLDMLFFPMFVEHGCKLRNRIVWTFNFGLHARRRFSGRYETMMWFTRSDEYTFNLDQVRVGQLYPGKRHSKAKGERAGRPSGNPNGKNPSDFWHFDPRDAFEVTPVWDIPNVKANHLEKAKHPCQFPSELADRCVLAMTNEGDIVLDPFVGTGTSVICAHGRNRVGLGFELNKDHADLSHERLRQFQNGELRLRTAGKAPAAPDQAAKVAKVPEEWLAIQDMK
jgi:adenine-specific DNA-methyltransferase